MVKKIIAVATTILMLCCMVPLSAFADTHTHTFGDNKRGIDMSSLPDDYYCPVTFYETPCSELCGYSKYEWSFGVRSESFVDVTGLNPLQVYAHWHTWFEKAYGAGANLKQYETGGGSAGTGGAGRRPSGYADDSGTPSVSPTGVLQFTVYPEFDFGNNWSIDALHQYTEDFTFSSSYCTVTVSNLKAVIHRLSTSSFKYVNFVYRYRFIAPVAGRYYLNSKQVCVSGLYYFDSDNPKTSYVPQNKLNTTASAGDTVYCPGVSPYADDCYLYYSSRNIPETYTVQLYPIIVSCDPTTSTISTSNNITINNNTWNGNIYQDNSTNLTYIYPQYTTINENNETVTNISENPIIYNNETKEYYTYDTVTNNYYYITYVTETPTPTPSPDPTPTPDPGTDPTPTPEPGGDTGDTTGILAVLVEIRDNLIQGFADLKATLVQGWADLSANFTLAIENLNLNITNIFNKKFPDQSTPETAQPSPSPSPSPDPSPSPTPDPDNPDATPTPTPVPTDKPSGGSTNNFWNFVFPGGNDDGTENGHKGILWALISLLIAVVTFVLGLGSAYSYVFPFLPAGLVTTIHICVLVLLLFAIIKFVRSFL